jgi:ABC-type nitrate/sulfonate/bicarbonate transport system substrate-binding protein
VTTVYARAFGRRSMGILAAASLALTAACGGGSSDSGSDESGPAASGELTKISIGVAAPTAEQSLPSVASELGFFADHGIEADVQLIAGGPQITAGLVGGSLDFGVYSAPGPEVGAVQGAPVKYVGVWTHRANLGLVVSEDIDSVEDLEGKGVAVSSPGTTTAIYTDMLLAEAGMDPETSVVRRNVGGQGPALNAFVSGQVSAAIFGAPVTYTAVAKMPGAKILIDYSEQDFAWPYAGIVTTEEKISGDGELIEKVLAALQDAAKAYQDPAMADQIQEIIATFTSTTDPALVKQSFDVASEAIDPSLLPREEDHANVLEKLALTTREAADFDPAKMFDASFAEGLDGNG